MSLGLLLLGLAIWPATPLTSDLAWGAASGVAGVIGVLLLYKGLADGRMSIVAPLTGLTAAAVPVAWSPFVGEVPSPVALVGIALALVAIVLVSRDPSGDGGDYRLKTTAMVRVALSSGAAFGVLFILLDETSPQSGMWPLVANRSTAICIVGVHALWVTRTGLSLPAGIGKVMVGCAIAGTAAEGLFLLATQRGLVAVASVLTSLYPASTVLLARFVLDERLTRTQLWGFGLAAGAVALIAFG